MKHGFSRPLAAAASAALLLLAWTPVLAEVSTDRLLGGRVNTLLMDFVQTITDGADPIPQVRWEPYRPLSGERLLNGSGAIRPDGRPDLDFSRSSAWPFVVWAYNNGTDHDVSYSQWTDQGWSPLHYLTAGPQNEIDPRVFIEPGGTAHVVWWVEADEPYVMLASSTASTDPTPAWSVPVRVSPVGQSALRPTVAIHDGVLRVAYETVPGAEPASGVLVVLRQDGQGGFVTEQTFDALRGSDHDPIFHVEETGAARRLWIDWKYSDSQLGTAVFANGVWGPTALHPWSDASWIGTEIARRNVRRSVLGLPPVGPVEPVGLTSGN